MSGVHHVSIHVRAHSVFEIQHSRSPDLNLKSVVGRETVAYSVPVYNEDTLQRIFEACQTIRDRTGTFEIVLQSIIRPAHTCIDPSTGVLISP
jgi:hypothetical protein